MSARACVCVCVCVCFSFEISDYVWNMLLLFFVFFWGGVQFTISGAGVKRLSRGRGCKSILPLPKEPPLNCSVAN